MKIRKSSRGESVSVTAINSSLLACILCHARRDMNNSISNQISDLEREIRTANYEAVQRMIDFIEHSGPSESAELNW